MKWININDKFPKNGKRVIVVDGDNGVCEGYWTFGTNKTIHWYRRDLAHRLSNVTHWMPLPTPPTV